MIESALARFLLSQPEITNLVGSAVYRERRRADGKPTPPEVGQRAITIGRVSTNRQYGLEREATVADVTLRLDCWAKGDNAWPTIDIMFETLRQTISGYRGDADGVYIHGSTITAEGTETESPIDSSDYWTAAYGFDLRLHHEQSHVEGV